MTAFAWPPRGWMTPACETDAAEGIALTKERNELELKHPFRVSQGAQHTLLLRRAVPRTARPDRPFHPVDPDRKSTRLNSSHGSISYAVFCLKKKIMICYNILCCCDWRVTTPSSLLGSAR